MGFILEPKHGDAFIINGWNWRPTISLLVREGVIPNGERAERCLGNGCGGTLSKHEALKTDSVIDQVISTMTPDQRVLHDGEITDKPIDYGKSVSDWTDEDTWNHYSVKYEALKAFAEFCRSSGGFHVH